MPEREQLEALERTVEDALKSGRVSGLRLLGAGEISLVLGWPADEPTWACKRLPPFPSTAAADAFEAAVRRYIDALTEGGIEVIDTNVDRAEGADGATVLYCTQPVLAPETMAVDIVHAGGSDAEDLVRRIVDTAAVVVDGRVGLDAQLSNWAVLDRRLVYFDVTTPLLRDAAGRSELDSDVFLASLPWVLRSPVKRFVLPGMLARYHDVRSVLLDLAANLVKERLDAWIPSVLDAANAHVDAHLTEAEVRADYRWTCRSRGTVDCADGTAISNQTDDPAASGSHGVDEGRTR